jgi:hypothetical protein
MLTLGAWYRDPESGRTFKLVEVKSHTVIVLDEWFNRRELARGSWELEMEEAR